MSKGKYFRTDEHKEKMRLAMGGRTFSEKTLFKKGSKPWNTGKHLPELIKKEISRKLKGKERLDIRGKFHPNWKGGITPFRVVIWHSKEYKLWRTAVFQRDKYICIWCGKKGGRLNADHIKPFALYPEFRFAIDNGRTLCVPCHRKTDTYGGRTKKYD